MLTQHLMSLIKAGNSEAITAEMIDGSVRNEAFIYAAENGHLGIVNRLIELTPDPEQLQEMIHADNNYACGLAVTNGHLEIVNRLIELTPDPEQLQQMIHYAFRCAAVNRDLGIVNRLIELTPDPTRLQQMIHTRNDDAFRCAAAQGHLEIVNRLIELTPDPAQLQEMLNSDQVFQNKNTATFLAIISTDDNIFRNPKISGPLNEKEIPKLKELRTNLIAIFVGKTDATPDPQLSAEATNKADSVIITLLTDNNLTRAKDSFLKKNIIFRDSSLLEESPLNKSMTEVFSLDDVNHFSQALAFPTLSEVESYRTNIELEKLFVGFDQTPSTTAHTVSNVASALSAATSSQNGHNL